MGNFGGGTSDGHVFRIPTNSDINDLTSSSNFPSALMPINNQSHILIPLIIVTVLVLLQHLHILESLDLLSLGEPSIGGLVKMADDAETKHTTVSHLHALVDMGRYAICDYMKSSVLPQSEH